MLRLIIGRAGTGKTAAVIKEIARSVALGQGGRILIVPEQYSHEAERELCAACGDRLSLYGEVLSFTGLARRVEATVGGGAARYLDKGGRLLCMALALNNVSARLRVYPSARAAAEQQSLLLGALDELKAACVTPEQLEQAAESCPGALGDKLRDLALIAGAYDAAAANGRADPADRLSLLAGRIAQSGIGPENHIYVDGFTDFTRQEQQVLEALLKTGAELTLCMTLDSLSGGSEIYELSRRSCRKLLAFCRELGQEAETELLEAKGEKAEALAFFADNMFSYADAGFAGEAPILLRRAESMTAECEFAAARALALVRDEGCRWRDIAVAVRGFEDYRGTLESVFRYYGVPLFTARRSELLSKPLPALIAGAYEIVDGGWDVDELISFMYTGLAGLDRDECDELSGYIYRWQLRAGAWERREDWRQHPEGYGGVYDEAAEERLARINVLRRRLAEPLLNFQRRGKLAATAAEQASALAMFFEELKLPAALERRALSLEAAGREELAGEYRQLWDITVSALEQSASILGDMEMSMGTFGKLFTLMLSKYDVGIIPVSLDRVSAGDFDRMRRRSIKHLIVLGCSDDRLPPAEEAPGVFTQEERRLLLEAGVDLGGGESELWREFSLIYNCLTLPSRSLCMTYSLSGAEGELLRPAFVFSRAAALFGIEERPADLNMARLSAPAPALSLAAHSLRGGGAAPAAAAEYFRQAEPDRFEKLAAAARMSRGRLSPAAAESLYGRRIKLSASKIDKFSACKFAYFCQYGLKAKTFTPAEFTPPEMGSFMHFILEKTAREVKERGGFRAVSDGELEEITDKQVQAYVSGELNDFREKSPRFVYLFKRLCADARQIVRDMAGELRRSDFEPLDFELDFSKAAELSPAEPGRGEEDFGLTGIADRVDGWVHEGKLYLRVVDYKTGKKKFSLSDVWYGMGLQMLLYLFTLQARGAERYGMEIVPAGVMYVPARNALLQMPRNPEDGQARQKQDEELRRSGLVLDDGALIEAWERGEDKRYIPIKFKAGKPQGDSLASMERLGLLAGHIRGCLEKMAAELHRGSITADPYYRSQQENACLNCDYYDACYFSDGENGESCRYLPKLSDSKAWGMMEGEAENE